MYLDLWFIKSLPWLKIIFTAILCVEMSRVNEAFKCSYFINVHNLLSLQVSNAGYAARLEDFYNSVLIFIHCTCSPVTCDGSMV
jgi:hypothetical protein